MRIKECDTATGISRRCQFFVVSLMHGKPRNLVVQDRHFLRRQSVCRSFMRAAAPPECGDVMPARRASSVRFALHSNRAPDATAYRPCATRWHDRMRPCCVFFLPVSRPAGYVDDDAADAPAPGPRPPHPSGLRQCAQARLPRRRSMAMLQATRYT